MPGKKKTPSNALNYDAFLRLFFQPPDSQKKKTEVQRRAWEAFGDQISR